MDLQMLQTFCEIARTKSIREAAISLHVTPSCVSRRLRSLEVELGTPLVVRSQRAIRLSDEGQTFLVFATRGIGVFREAFNAVGQPKQDAETIIGATPTLSFSFLPAVLCALIQQRPDLSFRIPTATPGRLFELILDGVVHIGLSTAHLPHPKLSYEIVLNDRVLAVASPSYLAARTPAIRSPIPVIRNPWEGQWRPWRGAWETLWERVMHSGRFRVVADVEYMQVAERLACRGLGVAFLPLSVAHASLTTGALARFETPECAGVARPVYAVVAKSRPAHVMPDALLDDVRSACRMAVGELQTERASSGAAVRTTRRAGARS